jgi:nucleoside-diphosphate-sugar epimerase
MIVVLGGAGFLGQHLRRRLVLEQRAFTVVSPSFPAGFPPQTGYEHRMTALEFEQPEGSSLIRSAGTIVNLISRQDHPCLLRRHRLRSHRPSANA